MSISFQRIRDHLGKFDFQRLFIDELGWSQPASKTAAGMKIAGADLQRRQIAQLAGVVAIEITAADGRIPDAKTRLATYREITKLHHENLLIFVDQARTQSVWYWVKREDGKLRPRDHFYFKGQPGDLFIGKLTGMVFDLGELDEAGNVPVVEVASRLKKALDVERVTKQFYRDYQEQHLAFLELIQGVADEHDRRWYASVLLNRLMFIYFLQRKGFIDYKDPTARDGNQQYLQDKLAETKRLGRNRYFTGFLRVLFFEGFAKPEDKRSTEARQLLGSIRYLNGGLFLPHKVEQECPKLEVPDKAFENLFTLFERYSWNLNDTPGERDDEIRPDVLGYIFEKYINQKAFGAYYTRTEITEYLCEQTIHRLILDAVNTPGIPGMTPARNFDSVGDLLMNLDANLCRRLLLEVLPGLSLLDPACGSGAFLVAAMRTLINVYSAVIGKIKFVNDRTLTDWLKKREAEHRSLAYFIKKTIITENLYGVDIMEEATEIARLRLFLSLVASAESVDQLEPLPNIDFNILAGSSLIGLMRVDDKSFEQRMEGQLFRQKSYRAIVDEKNRLVENFRHTATYADDLTALRDTIDEKKHAAREILDDLLLADFEHLGIKYEQATWDDKKGDEGRPVKRPLRIDDIRNLKPFHWGYEFDEILNRRGGFDAIITNPPWEVFQTDDKEFFQEHVPTIKKKSLRIEDWKQQHAKLMEDPDLRDLWLEYASGFAHVSSFFKLSEQYRNQQSLDADGNRIASKINLFKVFLEQCFNLLRPDGQCGIVVPSGIYTDLGAKQLREMLFNKTRVTGLFGIENRRFVFEGVDVRFKFVVLTFSKGGETASFPAAFMRHDVAELDRFPEQGSVPIAVKLVRRLSPDSLSVMEFKSELDVRLAEKMLEFPLLAEDVAGTWSIRLQQEINMTSDSHLFKTAPGKGRLPLYEGKMIWQFDHRFAEPRYWVEESETRAAVLGRGSDKGQKLDYQAYRLGFRSVASNTNERSLIASVIPMDVFCGNSVLVSKDRMPAGGELVFGTAVVNSFVVDWMLRSKVTTNINMFYIYQLPIPRLTAKDEAFAPIVERAGRLICTTPEFDALAKEVGLGSHRKGVTTPEARAKLRAELDGLIARLYGLTEDEFAYILTTFPLVPEPVKVAAQNAYRDVERGLVK